MVCNRTTRILPGYHHKVPVQPKVNRRDLHGQWGTLQPVNEESRFLTAWGPTKIVHNKNWVQISNPTTETVIIAKGTIVAAFHRGDENSYNILDWDVDVEERLLDHLQKEAMAKGTETAVRDYKDQLESIQAHEPAAAMPTDSTNAESTPTATESRPE